MTLTYEFDGNDFEFEVEESDLQRALIALGYTDGEDEELYRDELTDYFRDDACEEYKDAHELAVNPDRYYGVSRWD